MMSARTSLGEVRTEGDPDAPLVRARQRGEPDPPKHRGASVSAAWPSGELLVDLEGGQGGTGGCVRVARSRRALGLSP
jgi:hypothetical protein